MRYLYLKLLLSKICFWLGHGISKIMHHRIFDYLYPVYNNLMYWSIQLDENNDLWHETKENE